MKTKSKALLLVLSAVLLVVSSVMGTMAYLTDSDDVANTFTVGKVYINLDEAVVDSNGTAKTDGSRTEDGNKYHLIPGLSYDKDPTVTVLEGSENCYIRLKVSVTETAALDKLFTQSGKLNLGTFFDGYDSSLWNVSSSVTDNVRTYIFEYKTIAKANDKIVLFTGFTVPGTLTNEDLSELQGSEGFSMTVVAEAIQAAGFDNASDAWAAFEAQQIQ